MTPGADAVNGQRRPRLADLKRAKVRLNCEYEDRVFGRSPKLPRVLASLFRFLGAAAIGCLSATVSMLALYVFLNLVLNYQPA
jgi:hypothetical protein